MLAGLRDRELVRWLIACTLCCLLDEILVMFGALFMRDELGADASVQGIAFAVAALCGVIGLLVTERLLARVDPLRLLIVAALLCTASYVGWLWVRSIPASVVLLGLVGLTCAPLYPICCARAYAAKPGQAGLVAAVEQVFAWVPVLMPLLLGLIADRWGVVVSLAVLLLQPLGLALIAASAVRARAGSGSAGPLRRRAAPEPSAPEP
jgi:fucose permease